MRLYHAYNFFVLLARTPGGDVAEERFAARLFRFWGQVTRK
jgi:hypothetical protein